MTQFFSQRTRRKNSVILTKKVVTGGIKIQPNFLGQNENDLIFRSVHREKKLSHFDPKTWATGGTKIWHSFLVQNDSIFCSVHREK